MLPVEVAAEEGKPGRFLLGGLAVETWGLKVTLRTTLGMGRALFAFARSSRGDVSDMVGGMCGCGCEEPVAWLVRLEEKVDGRRGGWRVSTSVHVLVKRLSIVVPIQMAAQANAVRYYRTMSGVVVYRSCPSWELRFVSLRSEFEQIKMSSHARAP
jgi:hypothetical protein